MSRPERADPSREPARVRAMFGSIARRYDLLNHVLSANLDRRWRRVAIETLPEDTAARVLDLCGGTGDLTLEVVRRNRAGWAVCCDFSRPMLEIADRKFRNRGLTERATVLESDALRLPFPDRTFDAVTVAFGVRNLHDLDGGFREMLRVLRPGGSLVVLEFSTPTAPGLAGLYRLYLDRILPKLGDSVSGRTGPYGYLARTIGAFPAPDLLAGRIREAGFAGCEWRTLTGGIVAVHRGMRGD